MTNKILPALLLFFCACIVSAQYVIKTAKDSNGMVYSYIPGDPFAGRIYTLSNGMKVFLSRNDRKPQINTYIAVRAGSADDPEESTGLAHYFEHMMFKGNEKIASLNWEKEAPLLEELEQLFEDHRKEQSAAKRAEIYKKIDAVSLKAAQYSNDEYWQLARMLGASGTNAWTSFDETVYVNQIPSSSLEKFLKLESVRFQSIALRRFHTELESVYEEFNMGQDQDSRQAYFTALGLLFGKHPYGRHVIGLPEHIKAPSMRDIKAFFRDRYTPDNMALILSGSLDYEKTAVLAEKYFGKLPARKAIKTDRVKRKALAGPPLKQVRSAEITGQQAEQLVMFYRFEPTGENRIMLDLISEILGNGKCGLFDKNILLPQKVLGLQHGVGNLRDFYYYVIVAQPQKGQTLEQVRDLILHEINKLKTGDFPAWLPEAVVNNMRLSLVTASENPNVAARIFLESFIQDHSFAEVLNQAEDTAKISGKQIRDFAAKNFADNYVIVYKRSGKPTEKFHAVKPPITPVPMPRTVSAFARELQMMPSMPESEPVFPDLDKDLYRHGNHYASLNRINERFQLSYVFPHSGSLYDLRIPLAFSMLGYLGTDRFSAAALQEELYKLAGNISYSSGYFNSKVTVTGLQRNFDAIMKILPAFSAYKADNDALKKLTASILKERENSRKDLSSVFSRGARYALYGGLNSLVNHYLPEKELKSLTSGGLLKHLSGLPSRIQPDIFYYGPLDAAKNEAKIFRPFPGSKGVYTRKTKPQSVKFCAVPQKKDRIILIDYPAAQTVAYMTRLDAVTNPKPLTFAALFGEYAQRVFWTELRERRALAYSAGGYYLNPTIMLQDYSTVSAYVMTQGDKLRDGILAMKEQLDRAEIDRSVFQTSVANIQSRIRNNRVHPESLYSIYQDMLRCNLTEYPERTIYRELSSYTPDTFMKEWKSRIGNRATLLVIVGDLKRINRNMLTDFGTITTLTLDEIFRK